ncbi:unnamed protein product [Callosobruchus maculatus]|uniref:Uncharacterized protein n=1 Tax=Callosobruchus maculatus TaxID=64391 RepID=A0A653DBQ6_CALMS|nr:unnamed protein product [Callosobruchus maculatus]
MYQIRPLTLCMLWACLFFANGSDPTFEIITGNCTNPPVNELILQRRLRPEPSPKPGHLEQLITWSGDETIYCITVISPNKKEKHSTAQITAGGLNFRFVDILLKSESGFGFQYDVNLYGKIK